MLNLFREATVLYRLYFENPSEYIASDYAGDDDSDSVEWSPRTHEFFASSDEEAVAIAREFMRANAKVCLGRTYSPRPSKLVEAPDVPPTLREREVSLRA